jgi:hypothetical protein
MVPTLRLTLSLLMYVYGFFKASNFNVVCIYIYGPTFGNAESGLFLFAAQCFNTESMQKGFLFQLCGNTLSATEVTLITDGV